MINFFPNHCCHEVISSTFAWKMKRRHSPLIGPGTAILIRSQWMYWKWQHFLLRDIFVTSFIWSAKTLASCCTCMTGKREQDWLPFPSQLKRCTTSRLSLYWTGLPRHREFFEVLKIKECTRVVVHVNVTTMFWLVQQILSLETSQS